MTVETGSRGFGSDLAIRGKTALTWVLTEDLVWTGESDTIIVPAGFETDFATSPRFLHWLWLPYGAYTRAAVLHDYLLDLIAAAHRNGTEPPFTSRDADGIFRVAMRDLSVGYPKRWLGWTAVRWGALFNSERAYGRDFRKDALKVLGISLLALPVILDGVIGVLLSLLKVRIITALSGGSPTARRTRRGRLAGSRSKGQDHG